MPTAIAAIGNRSGLTAPDSSRCQADPEPKVDDSFRLRPEAAPVDGRLETLRAAGAARIAIALLFVASILLLRNQPAGTSTATEIRDF